MENAARTFFGIRFLPANTSVHGATRQMSLQLAASRMAAVEGPMFHAGRSNAPTVILVVEQDESLRSLLCAAFEDEGYQVHSAAQTPSAAEVAEMRPDLMMIDVERTDNRAGWQLVEEIRATPRMAHVPIVVCSDDGAIVAPQDVRARSEAAAILVKPFSLNDLLPVVATALDRRDLDRRDLYRSIEDLLAEPVVARNFGSIGF